MFLANHTPNKGLPVLLDAFTAMERPFLLIVGGEKRPDVDYDAYIRKAKSGQQIVITGRLSDAEIRAALGRSDLFVFPTLADTFPLVVLEAMAHGVPVLASHVGGIPYQVTPDCGVMVEPRDVAGVRAAVEQLAGQRDRLVQMGRNARQRALAEFTWEKAAIDAVHSYRRVLERQSAMHAGASAPAWGQRGRQQEIAGRGF